MNSGVVLPGSARVANSDLCQSMMGRCLQI